MSEVQETVQMLVDVSQVQPELVSLDDGLPLEQVAAAAVDLEGEEKKRGSDRDKEEAQEDEQDATPQHQHQSQSQSEGFTKEETSLSLLGSGLVLPSGTSMANTGTMKSSNTSLAEITRPDKDRRATWKSALAAAGEVFSLDAISPTRPPPSSAGTNSQHLALPSNFSSRSNGINTVPGGTDSSPTNRYESGQSPIPNGGDGNILTSFSAAFFPLPTVASTSSRVGFGSASSLQVPAGGENGEIVFKQSRRLADTLENEGLGQGEGGGGTNKSSNGLAGPNVNSCISANVRSMVTFDTCEDLLRACDLWDIMHCAAHDFSSNAGSDATYERSRQTENIGTFISHNWSVPRVYKFMALIFRFNTFFAATVAALLFALFAHLSADGLVPAYDMNTWPYHRGFLARLLIAPIFLVAMVVRGDIWYFLRCCPRKVFLDKVCIHQVDAEKQRAAIERLAAFLLKSKEMMVIYTDVYLRRMWTVYEIGSFLSLHPKSRLTVVPAELPAVFFIALIIFWVSSLMSIFFEGYDMVRNHEVQAALASYLPPSLGGIGFVFLVRRKARVTQENMKDLSTFTIRNCLCLVEADRELIQSNIIHLMREVFEDLDHVRDDAVALDFFDLWVRQELPEVLANSGGRFTAPYRYIVLVFFLTRGPLWVDSLVSVPHGQLQGRELLIESLSWLGWLAFIYPLAAAGLDILGKMFLYRRSRRGNLCLVLCVIFFIFLPSFGLLSLDQHLAEQARAAAPDSDAEVWIYLAFLFGIGSVTLGIYLGPACNLLSTRPRIFEAELPETVTDLVVGPNIESHHLDGSLSPTSPTTPKSTHHVTIAPPPSHSHNVLAHSATAAFGGLSHAVAGYRSTTSRGTATAASAALRLQFRRRNLTNLSGGSSHRLSASSSAILDAEFDRLRSSPPQRPVEPVMSLDGDSD